MRGVRDVSFLSPAAETTLNIVGFSLAILDFTGLSRRIEAGLARYRDWERDFVGYAKDRRNSLFDFKRIWPDFLNETFNIGLGLLIAAGIVFFFGDLSRADPYLPDWPHWVWWSLLACVPIFWVIYFIITHLISGTLMVWTSEITWRVFWVLSRPKAGVLGTIGLAIAAIGFIA